MKKVILKKIAMQNFKGEKERTTEFCEWVTTISGKNGLGKSRHMDAFLWLLFGKDSHDRKDYEIKTRTNGEELHNVECSVTGVFDVNGALITLKRAFVEDWVKPRGQVDLKLKGNHTECWWNDVPVNVSEYSKRVEEIVGEEIFKMLSMPGYFCKMKWQLQREQLFQMANVATDAEIASRDERFAILMDAISGKSLVDFKKELSARKKKVKLELDQIQPRIDQTEKMKPAGADFAELERNAEGIKAKIANVEGQIFDEAKAVKEAMEKEADRQKLIGELKIKQQHIELKVKQDDNKRYAELNEERIKSQSRLEAMRNTISEAKNGKMSNQVEVARLHNSINEIQKEQASLRNAWQVQNEHQFKGETTCPHCGQQLPASMIAKAEEVFNSAKKSKLEEITANGRELGLKIKSYEDEVTKRKELIENADNVIAQLTAEVDKLKNKLNENGEAKVEPTDPATIAEWRELHEKIEELEKVPPFAAEAANCKQLQGQKKELNEQLDCINKQLADKSQIDKCNIEIARLSEEGARLGQQLADCEKEEYTLQQFMAAKIEDCEKRINSLFNMVSFRLFDYTLDGNPVECCTAMVNGIPYGSANTASKVNAGLDIINALVKHYGISVPVFCDNTESVNSLMTTDSQQILLKVTNENKLTVN